MAGPNFGPASRCLLTVQRESERVFAVCPGQAPFVVASLGAQTSNQISWIRYVPAPGTLFFTDYALGRLLRTDSRASGMNLSGHVVISTEYGGEVFDLYYDQATASYKTKFYAYAPIPASTRLEDLTYAPGRGRLEPVAGAFDVGLSHTVTATITDVYGAGFPGVPLTFVVTGANPRTAVVTTDAQGRAVFTYNGATAGTDTITASYSVIVTNTAVVNWAGNGVPVANGQSITTAEDTSVSITLTGTDPENEALTFAVAASPQHGTLSGVAPNLTYAPAPNYNGPDSFTFTVTDASGATSAPAAVSITVTPVNDGPAAIPQSTTTAEDTSLSIALTGTDPENEALTFAVAASPQHGTLSGVAPNLTYAPVANYNGSDTFSFTVTDASGATSAPATVSITVMPVNDGPTATAQSITTAEDTSVSITLTGTDPENDVLTFAVTASPQHGTLSGIAPTLTYAPAANHNGPDGFTFTATDASGATSAPATVAITVTPVNDGPAATQRSITTAEDTSVSITLTGTDPENEALTFAMAESPQHGTLSGVAPNLTYAPAANYNGPDGFSFTATDASGATSAPATVSITVTPVNDGPTATPQSITTAEDTSASITLTGTDPENEALTFAVAESPQHGTLSGVAPNLTYAPASNYNGPDGFTFTATDASGATSAPATVSITVTPVNDGPTATAQSITTAEDTLRVHHAHGDGSGEPGVDVRGGGLASTWNAVRSGAEPDLRARRELQRSGLLHVHGDGCERSDERSGHGVDHGDAGERPSHGPGRGRDHTPGRAGRDYAPGAGHRQSGSVACLRDCDLAAPWNTQRRSPRTSPTRRTPRTAVRTCSRSRRRIQAARSAPPRPSRSRSRRREARTSRPCARPGGRWRTSGPRTIGWSPSPSLA